MARPTETLCGMRYTFRRELVAPKALGRELVAPKGLGGKRVRGSVMFSDIRDFTPLVESQPPEATIELLNTYYTLMFNAISGHGGIVSLIIGDGLMAIFGAPLPLPDHCDSAVRAALEMFELIQLFNVDRAAAGKPEIRIGIGIASGEMVAGYTGTNERATYTCEVLDSIVSVPAPTMRSHSVCE